jgi:P4 family phage/plasmid primase-like protien
MDHPQVKEIENFVASIHPEEDIKRYVMCYIASLLEGGNNDQKIIMWIGTGGSNGKGTLIELIDHTLGDYFGTLPVTLLTQKRKGSSNATPELADKKGKRSLVLQEPEQDDKINVGYMKELTGQDKILARALYAEPFYFVPQFKIFLACNKLPEIPSDDGGTWRRIRVVDHHQRFVDEPTKPNEHPKDPMLRNKLKTWKQAFVWLLLNKYFPIYKKHNGLDKLEPESVKLSTNKYKEESNVYLEYLNENIDRDEKECIPVEMLWNTFKEWYANNHNDKKPPPMKKMVEYFKNNAYTIKRGNIYGIKLKDGDNDHFDPLDG